MNRRKFLSWLGVGSAALVVAPAVIAATKNESQKAVLGEWNNYYNESSPEIAKAIEEYEAQCQKPLMRYNEYVNFSDLAIRTSIDEQVAAAASQLSQAMEAEINRLYRSTL